MSHIPSAPPATPSQSREACERQFRYSLSIGWFYTDIPLIDRFQKARDAGFSAVEMFWPDVTGEELYDAAQAAGVDIALFNMYEGDYAAGDRGFAADQSRVSQWRAAFDDALAMAMALHCSRINVLTGDVPQGDSYDTARDCLIDNLIWAGPRAAELGTTLVIEPLNHLTHPRYVCQRTNDAIAVLKKVDHPNVALQYDLFHAQCSEGNLISTIRENAEWIKHVQFADVPTRSAPGTGEINFDAIVSTLVELGYDGFVGLEYDGSSLVEPFAWLPYEERGKGW